MDRPAEPRATREAVLLGAACLGAGAVIVQLVTLREFLGVFAGNELTIGIVLANWLLLTGAGSRLGRLARGFRDPLAAIVLAQAACAILPLVQIAALRRLRTFFPPGLLLGVGDAFLASLLLLLPFCLLSGFLLAAYSGPASERRDARQIGDVYACDTLGGLLGGALFSFALVFLLPPFPTLAFAAFLQLSAAFRLAEVASLRRAKAAVLALSLAAVVALAGFDLERRTAEPMFPGQELLYHASTPYGSLAATRQGRQITVYADGAPVGSTQAPFEAEEAVHYALSQHPDPRTVLLVSGILAGTPREAAKYPVERIDCVEPDPAALDLAAAVAGIGTDRRLRALAADARELVRSSPDAYDAILLALPDPSSVQVNRYYTLEFFLEARRALRAGGVLGFRLSGAENYAGPEVRLLAASVYRAVSAVFPHVLVVPGERSSFVASTRPLDYDFAERLRARGIETQYVREGFLADRLTDDRLAATRAIVTAPAEPNRDFRPSGYHAYLRYWMSRAGSGPVLPALLLVGLVVAIGALLARFPRRAVPAAMCASGFAGMALQVLILIGFQVCYGYVYRQLGLILTAFMAGAAGGALFSARRERDPARLLFRLDAALAALAFILGPVLLALQGAEGSLARALGAYAILPGLNGLVGFCIGAQFAPAARVLFRSVEETAGDLYALDLLGACLGAIVVGALCVPWIGVPATAALIGAVKLITTARLRPRATALVHEFAPPRADRQPDRTTGAALLLAVAAAGAAIAAESTSAAAYDLSFAPGYPWILAALLGAGIVAAMDFDCFRRGEGKLRTAWRRGSEALLRRTKIGAFRWIQFLGFALVAVYPIFRCWFTVPYLFCHVCPRKCIFGFMRPYLVPAALIMNLERRSWCVRSCPLGTLFDAQARACPGARRLPDARRAISLAVLAFVLIAYFAVLQGGDLSEWYAFFHQNAFTVSVPVIAVAAGLILAAFRWRRPFCEAVCPIGTCAELLTNLERRTPRKGPADAESPDRPAPTPQARAHGSLRAGAGGIHGPGPA